MILSREYDDTSEPVHAFSRQDTVVLLGGAIAGLLGSIAMIVITAAGAIVQGESLLFPVKLIATTAFGPEVAHAPATTSVVVTGLMIHLLVGITFGIIFGYVADALRPRTTASLIVAGVAYGIAVYLAMFLYLVPALAPLLGEQEWIAAAIGHIAYGATLALYWPITERLHERNEDVAPVPLPTI